MSHAYWEIHSRQCYCIVFTTFPWVTLSLSRLYVHVAAMATVDGGANPAAARRTHNNATASKQELIFRRRYSITESIGGRTATTIAPGLDVYESRCGRHAPPKPPNARPHVDRRFNLRRQFHAWPSQVNWVSRYHFDAARDRRSPSSTTAAVE